MATKRLDKRKIEETREVKAKVGVIPRADGSAMFSFGDSVAIAAVYGPKKIIPAHSSKPDKCVLRCFYDMNSFSVTERKRPGPSRRSTEISFETTKALEPVLDLEAFPGSVIDVFIMIVQADASTRCAGINAASMALAQAGLPMKELVSSVAVGKIGDLIVADLSKEEEDFKVKGEKSATDIATSFTSRSGKLTLLHLDGKVTQKELKEALELAKKVSQNVTDIQTKALKDIKDQ
ncbi:MAG: exosome complex exonuclease Rrp41 [archaeon]